MVQEFYVYSLAVTAPWNPCNRAVRWRWGDEGDGRAGGQAAGQAACGQGSVEGAPRPKNHLKTYVFVRFLKHRCDSHTVLKLKIRNLNTCLKFEPKRRRPARPARRGKVVYGLLLGTYIPSRRSQDYGSSNKLPQIMLTHVVAELDKSNTGHA